MGASQSGSEKSIHEFRVKDYKAKDVDLSVYKGKVLLVVNVASKCGLTDSNYTQLTELYNKYKDRGFEILAFPCNQFLKQEPGSSEQAQEFACTRYKAEYPIFHKVKETIILGVTGRRGGFPPATAENPQQQQHEAKNGSFSSGGGGSSEVVEGWGFQLGGGFRRAKRGSFSSTGVLPTRDDDNGRKKLILIELASSDRTGRFIRFTGWTASSSGPTPVQYHSGPIGWTGPEP
ncbi:putative glutathione peroxidase 4 [Vitis vinifera]|uniref:Glutathione peroxidase n=1 Tax=Vitis vinifera TaxID=29760 RepID=A0A438F4A3_VITVI|nr:putative glutathione peroxidase 4 [Vitis vinifera]